MTEHWRLGAATLADGFQSGSLDPVDVLDACVQRATACGAGINALIHIDAQGAREAAIASRARWAAGRPLSPIDGVPVTVKDNLHVAGWPTTWGSRLLRDYIARQDEAPVAQLRESGVVLFGKTNLPEFALQGVTDNMLIGATTNPWDRALTPGGSSGGAAAAVACGIGPLALATDGGGSTRRPASYTAVVGFKPSPGLIARGGGLPEIFLDFEVPGILGRRVADVMLMSQVLAVPGHSLAHALAQPARILYLPRFANHPVDSGIAQRMDAAAHGLSQLGHRVHQAPPADWAEAVNDSWGTMANAGLAWMLERAPRFAEFGLGEGQAPDMSQCGAAALANAAQGAAAPATALFDAFAAVHQLKRRIDELFLQHDFILTPATAAMPWDVRQTHPAEIDRRPVGARGHAVFTAFANAAGLPAIALPAGFVGALPTGLQLVARPGADAALLALALQYEQAFPWHDAWPPEATATIAS